MGEALISAAREAGIRITLLDTCYLAGGLPPVATCRWTRCSSGSPTAAPRPGPSGSTRPAGDDDRADRRRGALGAGGARATTSPSWASRGRDGRPLHVHLSEQPGENLRVRGLLRLLPDRAARGRGPARPGDDRGARDPPVRRGHRAARLGTRHRCFCPTTERDLADGIGPARLLHDAGCPLCARLRPARRHRPVRGDARRRDARAARRACERGRFAPGRAARHGHLNGYRSLGWDDGGVVAGGHLADLVAVRLDSPRTAGLRPGAGALRGDAADVDRRRRRRSSRSWSTGGTGWATSGALLARRDRGGAP